MPQPSATNIGFLIGHYGGRPLLDRYRKTLRVKPETIARGEALFERHGAATIFVARFIAGMRVIAGPLAGVLRMHWRKFAPFNFLGAALWVAAISMAGYLFGEHWEVVVRMVRSANITMLIGAVAVIAVVWLRRRRNRANLVRR